MFYKKFCDKVTYNKCYNILKWMIKNNIYTEYICFEHIVRDGRIDILILCVEHNIKIYINIYKYVFIYNKYEIFKWLVEEKKFIGKIPFKYIILHGNLDILKFAIDNDLIFDVDIIYYTSLNKKFDFLKWIIENSNITGKISFENVIKYGNIELFKLCYVKSPDVNVDDIYYLAAVNDHRDIIRWVDKKQNLKSNMNEAKTNSCCVVC